MTDFYQEDGTVDRVSQHTGTDLWTANHVIGIPLLSSKWYRKRHLLNRDDRNHIL